MKDKYCVYKKNGQFHCRLDTELGSVWFDSYGKGIHSNLDSAIEQLRKTKEKHEAERQALIEVKVFEL